MEDAITEAEQKGKPLDQYHEWHNRIRQLRKEVDERRIKEILEGSTPVQKAAIQAIQKKPTHVKKSSSPLNKEKINKLPHSNSIFEGKSMPEYVTLVTGELVGQATPVIAEVVFDPMTPPEWGNVTWSRILGYGGGLGGVLLSLYGGKYLSETMKKWLFIWATNAFIGKGLSDLRAYLAPHSSPAPVVRRAPPVKVTARGLF